MKENRENFAGSFTAILALAGSAVGLGNLWRFPYLMGENGGAAFIIVYILMTVFLSLPIFLCEFIVGRHSSRDVIGAYKVLSPNKPWKYLGVFSISGVICVLSFYSVVGGWGVEYFIKSVSLSIVNEDEGALATMFSDFVSNPYKPLLYHSIFLALTAGIVVAGVKKGIERFSKVMMPLLFVLMIAIAVRSLTLPGAETGLKYLFHPDFSKLDSHMLLMALGQSFFSVSLGVGTIVTYGSYVNKKESILKCTAGTAIFDTLFALVAGCAIMPAVFAFGLNPSEGPGLVFVTLPHIFSQMPAGQILAIIFFLALLLAALTSSISMLEVVIAWMVEELHLSRLQACCSSFLGFWILGALCSLSQGVLSDFLIFGKNFFDLFDYVSANILMLGGGLLTSLFVGWYLGPKIIREELSNKGSLRVPEWFMNIVIFLIKFVAPMAVLAIMIL